MNGSSLNIVRGKNTSRGILMPEEIKALSAPHVLPTQHITVFVFPIQNALKSHNEINKNTVYSATRGDWRVTQQYRDIENAYAVGLTSGFSRGAYKIAQWEQNKNGKYYFNAGDEFSPKVTDELVDKSWLSIIAAAKGYYQRGNHLVVEFNNNQFKIIRGCQGHNWTSLN